MAKIKVIADENVHMAIVEGLKRRGVTAWSVQTAGRGGLSDEEQLEYTTSQGACLLTHDERISGGKTGDGMDSWYVEEPTTKPTQAAE